MALPMKRAPAMKAVMKRASVMKAAMKKRAPAMKKRSAMKKRVSKIARGPLSHALVLRGAREKTVGGLTKADLMRNKRGKVVSKKASAGSKRAYAHIKGWSEALAAARKALNVIGFVAINGKTAQGKALYAKAKAIYSARG